MPHENRINQFSGPAGSASARATDFAAAREIMVESQLRPSGVHDRKVISAMESLPRERFVSEASLPLAYMDGAVPVDVGGRGSDGRMPRYLAPPMVLARMIQLAEPDETDRVLVVGCATGYSVAVLSCLAGEVIGLECDEGLAARAASNLKALDVTNARIVQGTLTDGAASDGPYDLILMDGSVPTIPTAIEEQVKEGGRLVGVVSNGVQGTVYLFVKTDDELVALPQFSAGAKPLPGFAAEAVFDF
ncbi:Protein-L-isoaspartate O-methyltransferase [Methyloligella halotolerans]|uniref:Protein-L-isoaspartate O-methyltransferase n=1 Tax=Methyloligella halotolerans TaxID=1177755 RepID=A0A1E2S2U3_9HYPH|nr:protein-L-isoaspartate O-methyltransferase [Methyloligella halotolerans]ODA68764.1 Protein-L-isoaspartate O-methyltransferase [Methyloligella halotolerans]